MLDLASGTGANLRFLAPLLGGEQHWRLVDHDPVLLARGEEQCGAWVAEGDGLDAGLAAGGFGRRLGGAGC